MYYESLLDMRKYVPLESLRIQYLRLLSHLTDTPDVPLDMFSLALDEIEKHGDIQVAYTAEKEGWVLHGAVTILYETKLIHGCRKVGHIEDLVVLPDDRSKGVASTLLHRIRNQAEKSCYKIILDCKDDYVPFYEHRGFERRGSQMAYYFDPL
jgi:glucosamine-phosphate N-acetyltransferase